VNESTNIDEEANIHTSMDDKDREIVTRRSSLVGASMDDN
jgi:hypothetical protein